MNKEIRLSGLLERHFNEHKPNEILYVVGIEPIVFTREEWEIICDKEILNVKIEASLGK